MTSTAENAAVIHAKMTIEEILSSFPGKAQKLAQEMTNAGLHCAGCHAATWETLEAGLMKHGMGEKELESLLKKLNAVLQEEDAPADQITMTKAAANKFREFQEEEGKVGYALRISEKMAGCSGFEYELGYSEKALEDDLVFVSEGIEIHVKKVGVGPRLMGSEIDYVDGLLGSGFKISNPNVRSSCGCGSSHGY